MSCSPIPITTLAWSLCVDCMSLKVMMPIPASLPIFSLAPDTSAETYHIEFRYGSDADALSQYDAGDYAYWLASGISTDCDQTMIDNCIELFCTENLAG